MTTTPYREATRVHTSLLAAVEKRCLIWMAARIPAPVNSDHLTVLAGLAMAGAGLCYWIAGACNGTAPVALGAWAASEPALKGCAATSMAPMALFGAVFLLAVNWFGDSLDGTLARVRHHERPRYGFYVDHVLDALGILFILGGLVLGGHMSPAIGAGFLLAYYLLTIEIALATHAVGTFRISYWKFGPTELRILLAIGTLLLLRSDSVTIAGTRYLLFDVGGAVAIAGLIGTFIAAAVSNTRTLYRLEPLPRKQARDSAEHMQESRPLFGNTLQLSSPGPGLVAGSGGHDVFSPQRNEATENNDRCSASLFLRGERPRCLSLLTPAS